MNGNVWKWAATSLALILVSAISFWLVEASEYVTRPEVAEVIHQDRREIMRSLDRIESAVLDMDRRLRESEIRQSRILQDLGL